MENKTVVEKRICATENCGNFTLRCAWKKDGTPQWRKICQSCRAIKKASKSSQDA